MPLLSRVAVGVLLLVAVFTLAATVPTSAVVAIPPSATAPVVLRAHAAPRVRSGLNGHQGVPATIACGTCHAGRSPDPANRSAADLNLFHQGLTVVHGSNTCLSCHNPGDYDSLRLANGTSVPFERAIDLCSQCHGPQRRDFDHGAHGGMNGHWDLKKGGRTRNVCIDCHDPHVPKYQSTLPMPPPRDRFLVPAHGGVHE